VSYAQQSANPLRPPIDANEHRMVSGMRSLLAATALLVTVIDPSEPSRFVAATYSVLALYLLYSSVIHLLALRGKRLFPPFERSLHWIDVGFYVTLIALSGGTNSIYFVLFFFCIIESSFRWGFGTGLMVTAVSLMLYGVVGYAMRLPDPDFDLNRFLLRSSALPVLGYLIAYWGGYELRLKQRLSLLKEISALSDPRAGIDRTLGANMERLRAFFRADACVTVLADADKATFLLRRARPQHPEAAMRAEPVSEAWAKTFALGDEDVMYFRGDASVCLRRRPPAMSSETLPVRPRSDMKETCRAVAELLDTTAFLSVPLCSRRLQGRLFLLASQPSFGAADGDFLSQAVDQFMPVLDHILLADRMAARAADEERQRIALDIHDRIIQPYVGLRLGLLSLGELLDAVPADRAVPVIEARTKQLAELSAAGIAELRQYVQALRQGATSGAGLAEGLRRYTERFFEATGIRVDLEVADDFQLDDRLAADVFSMVTEGISNIRRHTHASHGRVELARNVDRLRLSIENPADPDTPPKSFLPRSISERAAAWRGQCRVVAQENGDTAVMVEIPL
jgi:signal transduction histidine kinase